MAIAPETVFELVSTIYYKAMWRENFWEVKYREGKPSTELREIPLWT